MNTEALEVAQDSKLLLEMYGALRWLLDDNADAGMDRNPATGEEYDSNKSARLVAEKYENLQAERITASLAEGLTPARAISSVGIKDFHLVIYISDGKLVTVEDYPDSVNAEMRFAERIAGVTINETDWDGSPLDVDLDQALKDKQFKIGNEWLILVGRD